MKKFRRASFLAAVAIVSSATMIQIREHMQSPDASTTNAQEATMSSCSAMHDGFLLAKCERTPTRDERQMERAPQPQQDTRPQMWV